VELYACFFEDACYKAGLWSDHGMQIGLCMGNLSDSAANVLLTSSGDVKVSGLF
jgi:hypothetical protein